MDGKGDMPRSAEEIKKQELRQLLVFPDDRIAFKRAESTVKADINDLKRWANGEITLRSLRKRIAKNNYLDNFFEDGMILEKMMVNELRLMGWDV